jgi:hypothetical protein
VIQLEKAAVVTIAAMLAILSGAIYVGVLPPMDVDVITMEYTPNDNYYTISLHNETGHYMVYNSDDKVIKIAVHNEIGTVEVGQTYLLTGYLGPLHFESKPIFFVTKIDRIEV